METGTPQNLRKEPFYSQPRRVKVFQVLHMYSTIAALRNHKPFENPVVLGEIESSDIYHAVRTMAASHGIAALLLHANLMKESTACQM